MIPISPEQIKAIALGCGFKLKEQPDGSQDLNQYVYNFAWTLLGYPVTPWIDCNDRQPNEPGHYIVWADRCSPHSHSVRAARLMYDYERKLVWNDHDGKITHWMPMLPYPEDFPKAPMLNPSAALPNCMCNTPETARFCLLQRNCSRTIAY